MNIFEFLVKKLRLRAVFVKFVFSENVISGTPRIFSQQRLDDSASHREHSSIIECLQ